MFRIIIQWVFQPEETLVSNIPNATRAYTLAEHWLRTRGSVFPREYVMTELQRTGFAVVGTTLRGTLYIERVPGTTERPMKYNRLT